MRRVILCATAVLFIIGGQLVRAAHSHDKDDATLTGPTFQAGTLKFTIPAKWVAEPSDNPARVGQWLVPATRPDGEPGEVVVFFFGPGSGGTAKENIENWIGTMVNAEGHPAAAEVKSHQVGDFKISQVMIFGTYNQIVPLPGVPPRPRSNFGLLGAVVESPKGNIYWRFTGPEPLITATIPLFNKIIDSVKPQDK